MTKKLSHYEFNKARKKYNELNKHSTFNASKEDLFPIYSDYYDDACTIDEHYFFQDLLVAKLVIGSKCKEHFDIGSRVDGFISHLLAAQIEVTMLDIRPFKYSLSNFSFIKCDATNMSNIQDNSINSLSTLHAVEHFGLGRYGDPINPEGSFLVMKELQRILAVDGRLYFSVPVGNRERCCFNAHRVFDPFTITNTMKGLTLISFYLIKTGGNIVEYKPVQYYETDFSVETEPYNCGVFVFTKAK